MRQLAGSCSTSCMELPISPLALRCTTAGVTLCRGSVDLARECTLTVPCWHAMRVACFKNRTRREKERHRQEREEDQEGETERERESRRLGVRTNVLAFVASNNSCAKVQPCLESTTPRPGPFNKPMQLVQLLRTDITSVSRREGPRRSSSEANVFCSNYKTPI